MINTKKELKAVPQKIITNILTAALILNQMVPKANAINVTLKLKRLCRSKRVWR